MIVLCWKTLFYSAFGRLQLFVIRAVVSLEGDKPGFGHEILEPGILRCCKLQSKSGLDVTRAVKKGRTEAEASVKLELDYARRIRFQTNVPLAQEIIPL